MATELPKFFHIFLASGLGLNALILTIGQVFPTDGLHLIADSTVDGGLRAL
ncbi:MAG: hypothetical protein MJE68_20385 [Proteobacteria bacterium]|nr:hypothetical protein [Pseudomonadota bacterium]